jgi:O-antigen/teichoic acid export membrane protein
MIARIFSLNPKEVARFISAFASRFGSTLLSFIVLFVASRLLPTFEYGLYIFLFSVGSALGLIAVFGQQILVVKHYRRDEPRSDELNRALIRVNLRWLLLGSCILVAAAALLWMVRGQMASPYDALPIAFIFGAVFALSEYLQNYFRIHGRINMSLMPREIVWRGASAIAMIVVAYAGLLYSGVEAMLIITVLLAAATAYQVVGFVRTEGTSWLWSPMQTGQPHWRKESLYFIANNLLNACASYFETIVIGAVLGLDKAAFYFVALRIAMLLTLPITAIDTVGIPLIAAKFQTEDKVGAQRLIGRLSFASFGISLAGAMMIAIGGQFALGLFNPDFVPHFPVLLILCGASVSQAFFGPGSWLLMIGGGERFFLIARSSLFVAYLALLYWLSSLFGLTGVAIASVLFNVSSNLAANLWVIHHLGIDNMATAFFRPMILQRSDRKFGVDGPPAGFAETKSSTEAASGNQSTMASKSVGVHLAVAGLVSEPTGYEDPPRSLQKMVR